MGACLFWRQVAPRYSQGNATLQNFRLCHYYTPRSKTRECGSDC